MFIETMFWDHYVFKAMSICSNLIQFDPISSNKIQLDSFWANLL